MRAIFQQELKRTMRGLIIWCVLIVLLALMALLEYPVIGQYTDMMDEVMSELMPTAAQLVFGVYNVSLSETIGWFVVMYYWVGLIVFSHAIYMGASVISKETRDKTSEFLFTKPCKRSTIIWEKIRAGFANVFIVCIVATVMSLFLMTPMAPDSVIYQKVLIACFGMLLTQCVLMSIGLVCSAAFRTCKSGVTAAAIVFILSYGLMFFVQYIEKPAFNFLSPLLYFSVSEVVKTGLSVPYVMFAFLVIVLCLHVTQKLYRKKEMIA